jgi:serine/threonine kinase 38
MYEIPLCQLLEQKKINQRTYDKVIIGKQYIERKYNLKAKKTKEWKDILLKINSLNITEEEKEIIKHNIYSQEITKFRKARIKQSVENYESIAIIGRGAFGEVHVCRDKTTDEIVAIKKIKKEELSNKNQIIHIKNEQLFMSKVKSPWIVELKASFQDNDYLYLVMEYVQGGDLMNILIKKDILTEEEARFYIAEIILAVESIHKLDCIHRDIKPDNILIDKDGHIKLTDFGLAKISDKIYDKIIDQNKSNHINVEIENGKPTHNKNYSCVGTAYYVAPEVLKKEGYGPEIDWWSVGVIFYEMLVGYVPFCSKDTNEACYKVLYWKKYVSIPSHVRISKEAEDLIFKLINSPKNRLGKNGAKEIKDHPFFYGFNWDNIQNIKPPFIPFLRSEYDTSYFETFEKKEPFCPSKNKEIKRRNVEYLDYSFRNDSLNDISLNDEYEKAIKMINEKKKK